MIVRRRYPPPPDVPMWDVVAALTKEHDLEKARLNRHITDLEAGNDRKNRFWHELCIFLEDFK